MKAQQHLQKVHEAQASHIAEVIRCLKKDPLADSDNKKYLDENMEEYLRELIDKEGNLALGIIVALETYLEK